MKAWIRTPMKLLDVARMMEDSLPQNASSDGMHFDRPRGIEWLNGVFQRHINLLESDLVETGQFSFGPPPRPFFFTARPVADRLGERVKFKESSRSSRTAGLDTYGERRGGVFHAPELSSLIGGGC